MPCFHKLLLKSSSWEKDWDKEIHRRLSTSYPYDLWQYHGFRTVNQRFGYLFSICRPKNRMLKGMFLWAWDDSLSVTVLGGVVYILLHQAVKKGLLTYHRLTNDAPDGWRSNSNPKCNDVTRQLQMKTLPFSICCSLGKPQESLSCIIG